MARLDARRREPWDRGTIAGAHRRNPRTENAAEAPRSGPRVGDERIHPRFHHLETTMKYNKGAILRSIEQPFLRDDLPQFDTGDTIRVDYKVVEGNRTRVQAFEGVVIARKNGKGARSTVTVRKVSFGEGVERVFPMNSPLIQGIEVVRRGRTRRAKLYYLRNLRGKAARLRTDTGRQEEDRAAARAARDNGKG